MGSRALDEVLGAAVLAGDDSGVRAALELGADPKHRAQFPDLGSEPVLSTAVRVRAPGIVRQLLHAGAPPNDLYQAQLPGDRCLFNADITPFIVATWTPHDEIISAMLEHGADVSARDPLYGMSVLQSMIGQRQQELALRFIEHGAANAEALIEAAKQGDVTLLERLLESVAPSTAALALACSGGHRAAAEQLVARGARLDVAPDVPPEQAPLAMAARGARIELVEWLLELGAELSVAGPPALLNSIQHADLSCLRCLLDRGIPVHSRTSYGFTALMCAATRGTKGAVELLLAYGADPNAVDRQGYDALHWARYEKRADVVELLGALRRPPT